MAELVSSRGQRLFSVHLPGADSRAEQDVPRLIFRSYDEEAQVQINASVPVSVEGSIGFRSAPGADVR